MGFLIWNRAAYQGYFHADELDNLSWTAFMPPRDFLPALLTPRFIPGNFRPAGHTYFFLAGKYFGLRFPLYIATLHALHLFNVWLLWMLVRRLGSGLAAAGTCCVFFAFHMSLFDALWKPMYIFDVLCATFCLLSLLAWTHEKWVWSFIAFWLGYKSKELAVMLPMVLAAYEWWFGKRRWKPLLPFLVASLSFGLQGLLLNPEHDNDYTFRFTPAAVARTSVFYAGRMFLVPYLGFAMLPVALLLRRRRLRLGVAMMGLLFVPLLFLPGRIFPAYCYAPFLGLAIAISDIDARITAPLLLLWAPLDLHELRLQRRADLAIDSQVRTWITTAARFARTFGPVPAVVSAGRIDGFPMWGCTGALRYIYHNLDLPVYDDAESQARSLIDAGAPVLVWNSGDRKLMVQRRSSATSDLSDLEMPGAPVWQLREGWHELEGNFRWTDVNAAARLDRPPDAQRFTLRTLVVRPVTVRVVIDGVALEPHRFDGRGWQTAEWPLPPAKAGPVRVEFHCDTRPLGIAVGGFGFTSPAEAAAPAK